MDDTQVIAELKAEVAKRDLEITQLRNELGGRTQELSELRQRLEIRNLSLERLQAQFTVAADAVNKLLGEREAMRRSRWARFGMFLGLIRKMRDDL
jgi:chromosome segregation ATPase